MRPALLVGACGLVVLTALFGEALVGRRAFYDRDVAAFWTPRTETFVRTVAAGEPPFWDPHTGFGMPMLADPTFQVFYPFTWLSCLVPPGPAYTVLVAGHVLLAGAGMSLLCLRLGLPSAAGLAAALSWMAGGPFLSLAGMAPHLAGAALLAWVLWAVEGTVAGVRGALYLLAGLLAVQVFAGSGEMCVMTALLAAGRLLGRTPLRRLPALAGGGLLGAALAAPQWLPALLAVRAGSRVSWAGSGLYWSLHPASLVDVVASRLVSEFPLSEAARGGLFEGREPFLPSLYLGPFVLLLGLLGTADPSRRALRRWAAAGALTFALLALGKHGPLAPLLQAMPPFSLFRFPVKYALGLAFCLSLLLGLGVAECLGDLGGPRRRLLRRKALLGLAGLAVVLALAVGPARPTLRVELLRAAAPAADLDPSLLRVAGAAAVLALALGLLVARAGREPPARAWVLAFMALLAADLLRAGRGLHALAPPEIVGHRPPLVDLLRPERGRSRIAAVPHSLPLLSAQMRYGPAAWEPSWRWTLGFKERLTPLFPGQWGLDGSFDGDVAGLAPPLLGPLSHLVFSGADPALSLRLLRLGNVSHVVALEPPLPELRPAAAQPSVYAAPVLLLRVPDPMPRAYVVASAPVLDDEAALRRLRQPDFDPRHEVILSGPGGGLSVGGSTRGQVADLPSPGPASAFEVRLDRAGVLVVVRSFAPGWSARLDGRPAALRRANLLFQAVVVPGGTHRVEFSYEPPGLRAGLLLAAAGLAAAVVAPRARRIAGPVPAAIRSPADS